MDGVENLLSWFLLRANAATSMLTVGKFSEIASRTVGYAMVGDIVDVEVIDAEEASAEKNDVEEDVEETEFTGRLAESD